ncbi:MAG: ATP-binding cassette domain-containing protein [Clostridia bacterium]|nr:ATP-binding cassette domain-containing protein [Clostridia bacterium]
MSFIEVKNLNFSYPEQEVKALDDINLDIDRGDFVIVYGPSGCSKTTLLKHLKPEIMPHGTRGGDILYDGKSISTLDRLSSAQKIAYIPQNTTEYSITHKVYRELAFSLECMGIGDSEIYTRIAECCEYFGIGRLFDRDMSTLSGGERKIVSIAAAMCLNPELMILDEPLSQLDPISCKRLVSIIERLNKEKGITIIISEHRLEDIYQFCNKLIVMEHGKIILNGLPTVVGDNLKNYRSLGGFPSYVRLYYATRLGQKCPFGIADARRYLAENIINQKAELASEAEYGEEILNCKDICFAYDKKSQDVLSDLSFSLHKGEIMCVLGSNGSGKSTLLKVIADLKRPYKGKISVFSKDIRKYKDNELYHSNISYLPQDPLNMFSCESIGEDFRRVMTVHGTDDDFLKRTLDLLGISHLLSKNPRDVSGGELQKCALCMLLITSPRLLLLDEPSKGLDYASKQDIIKIMHSLKKKGVSVFAVTHDLEFAADVADTSAMLFNKKLIGLKNSREFFCDNKLYTTPICRITDGILDGCVTINDVVKMVGKDEK